MQISACVRVSRFVKNRVSMKICCVCEKENSNYKCPTCRQPYCSSVCYKSHGESRCEPAPQETEWKGQNPPTDRTYDFPTEDTVPPAKLQLLKCSEDVRVCLENPHVRDIVTAILRDKDPTRAIRLAMAEPIFVELADACLRVVEPSSNDEHVFS